MALQLSGIHHLTAITADAPGNKRFYTDTLGLRLVKKTVNQDDTSAYHLFYADGQASPGTDITFFDWPAAPERRGTHAISRTGLRVAGETALNFWHERLSAGGYAKTDVALLDGRASFDAEDPEGQRLRFIDDGGAGEAHAWSGSPVPAEHQIRGLGPITISVPDLGPTEAVLTQVMNMRRERRRRRGACLHDGRRWPGRGVARCGPAWPAHRSTGCGWRPSRRLPDSGSRRHERVVPSPG